MTACVAETTVTVRRTGFTIAADGSYAACLAVAADECWYPERWTLDGPEPYSVPLPGDQPEEPGSEVLPLPDGRVLLRRRVADRHDLVLLYPVGPGTGELPLGSLEGEEVRLLPPAGSGRAYALTYDQGVTAVWHARPGAPPRRLADVPGRCTGGVWLDRSGRLLALDREADGHTKAVAVDLAQDAVTPLLQLTEDSDDRLLLAEPDSGLLVLRSDAPGEERIGWGVLGSRYPVRFPETLRAHGERLTPFAAQPGQFLSPETAVVALHAQEADGVSLLLWRPAEGRTIRLPGPEGWLSGTGLWSCGGPLRLPYASPHQPYGLAEYAVPPLRPTAAPGRGLLPVTLPGAPAVTDGAARPTSVLPLQQAPLAPAPAR